MKVSLELEAERILSMLVVASETEVNALIQKTFGALRTDFKQSGIGKAAGRVLAADCVAGEDVPSFNRSTVDGYAVRASDTFGCSENLPALLTVAGEIQMGKAPGKDLRPGQCMAVPTGGALPEGCDAVVMIEYCEEYGDGTVGILKPAAPGQGVVFRGDDVKNGQILLQAGKLLQPHDIGALAAVGITEVGVSKKPVVGILSTGDELIDISERPKESQVRDANSYLLGAAVERAGGAPRLYGFCRDSFERIEETVRHMADECDIVLISGGSSVGQKDATPRIIETLGTLLVHGIAIKPGKPTIVGETGGKPIFGLPGHPVATYFVFHLFVRPLIASMMGRTKGPEIVTTATLDAAVPSNHGREEYVAVKLTETGSGLVATPLIGKSGLIARLTDSDGYLRIPRDREGLSRGEPVVIRLFAGEA